MFITAFTRALHWFLSLAGSIQSIPPISISLTEWHAPMNALSTHCPTSTEQVHGTGIVLKNLAFLTSSYIHIVYSLIVTSCSLVVAKVSRVLFSFVNRR
jgi:hypothetical protein